jgi:lysyl-tRNA synthetase class 1
LAELRRYPTRDVDKQPDASVWHIFNRGENVPIYDSPINFSMISNVVSVLGTDDVALVQKFLERYDPSLGAYCDTLEDLIHKAVAYYQDHILPNKRFRLPTEDEREMLEGLHERLAQCQADDEQTLQALPFDTARAFGAQPSALFQAFYEVVLGQERGPRFGTLTRLIGKDRVLALISQALDAQAED